MPAPPDILELDEDSGKGRRVLRGGVHRFSGSDAGRPAIPHHFQHGGVYGSASLGVRNGVGRGRAG